VKLRLSLIAVVLAGVAGHFWHGGESSSVNAGPASAPAVRSSAVGSPFVGAGSCAAAACHNANFVGGQTGSEFTIWMTRDPHAKAYEVLFTSRSVRIQHNLHAHAKAHQDQRCLQCHVSPALDADLDKAAPYFRTDGVSCESCHGPARKWLNVHYLDSWKEKSRTEKSAEGMTNTETLFGRTQTCVKCHVGAAGMDVDHDLLAAGHPRLNFEFSSFHAAMPHHWPDAKDRDPNKDPRGRTDFEARAWLIGQLVTTRARLDQLAARAEDQSKPWPEYAEHDCAACHHNLSAAPDRRPKGKRLELPWSDYAVMAPLAVRVIQNQDERPFAELLARIRISMTTAPVADRRRIANEAHLAATQLKRIIDSAEPALPANIAWNDLLRTMIACESASRNNGTQLYMGLVAIQRGHPTMPLELADTLSRLAQGMDRPKDYDPAAIKARLLELQSLGVRKGL
jgi:hypothetical protein